MRSVSPSGAMPTKPARRYLKRKGTGSLCWIRFEAVAPSFEASHLTLFGEIMKLADEPRKKLSEWRRNAADISTQIKHEKRLKMPKL